MPLLGTVIGWSGFGLAARCWALAIQKRNIFDNLGGHALSMTAFAGFGYLYYGWDKRVLEMLEDKKAALRQIREAQRQSASSQGGGDSDE